MWLKRPDSLMDGILFASGVALVLGAIVIIKGASNGEQLLVPACQEVVVDVEKNGNVLAECPPGTYIEIDEAANVLCRCDAPRGPSRPPGLIFNDPMLTQPKNPDPEPARPPHDDKSTDI